MHDVKVLPTARLIIGDRHLTRASGGVFEHRYPATGEVQAEVPLAGVLEVDEALDVARAASTGWRRTAPSTRRDLLRRLAGLLRDDQERLGDIVSHEIGSLRKGTARNAVLAADWFARAPGPSFRWMRGRSSGGPSRPSGAPGL